jgi:hypothetical protein
MNHIADDRTVEYETIHDKTTKDKSIMKIISIIYESMILSYVIQASRPVSSQSVQQSCTGLGATQTFLQKTRFAARNSYSYISCRIWKISLHITQECSPGTYKVKRTVLQL